MIKGHKVLTRKIDGNAAIPQSAPPRIENEITAKSSKNLKIISSPNFQWLLVFLFYFSQNKIIVKLRIIFDKCNNIIFDHYLIALNNDL